MATSKLTARMLDGASVSLSVPIAVSNQSFTSFIELESPDAVRELAASGIDFGRWTAAELGIHSFDEEYALETGRLLIGAALTDGMTSDSEWLQRIAVWEGGGFSMKTTQIGGDPTALIAFFEQLKIDERDDGVVVAPMSTDVTVVRTGWHGPQLAITLSEFGIVHVRELTPDLEKDLPDAVGFPVAGGELFYVPGDRQDVLVLVGNRAYTKLYPTTPSESDALAFSFEIVAEWAPAQPEGGSANPLISARKLP